MKVTTALAARSDAGTKPVFLPESTLMRRRPPLGGKVEPARRAAVSIPSGFPQGNASLGGYYHDSEQRGGIPPPAPPPQEEAP
jgi:hypothetical protein